jgi:hypothetical protein
VMISQTALWQLLHRDSEVGSTTVQVLCAIRRYRCSLVPSINGRTGRRY